MNTRTDKLINTAETLAGVTLAGAAIALLVWLCVALPLWAVPWVFGVLAFLGLAFLGPVVTMASVAVVAVAHLVAALLGPFIKRARA